MQDRGIQLKDPIVPSFVLAAAVHVLLILAVGFGQNSDKVESPDNLAVTVAISPAQQAPDNARFIADQNQLGSSEVAPPRSGAMVELQTRMRVVESGVGKVDQQRVAQAATDTIGDQYAAPHSAQPERSPYDSSLVGAVPARAALDADYLGRWRAQVEQAGHMMFRGVSPQEQGDVRLQVTIGSDGSVLGIKTLISSGKPALDRAAAKSVRLAAPYPMFSEQLRQQTSQLIVIRTWQFRTESVSSR